MENKFPNKYLIIGICFVLSGVMLLLWTQGLLPGFKTLWPVPVIMIGLACLYLTLLRKKNQVLILPGMFLTLGGILLLLLNTVLSEGDVKRIWPAFMLVCGISLIPYGFKKKPKYRMAIFIPAFTIIFLALIFFPFSLGISPISFSRFVSLWWPVIPITIGGLFLSIYIKDKYNKHVEKE